MPSKLCCFRFCSKNETESVDLDYYGKAKLADEDLSTANDSGSEILKTESPPPSHLGIKKSKHTKEKGSTSYRNGNKIPNHESGKAKKTSKPVDIEKPHTTENSSKNVGRNSSVTNTSFIKKGYISTQKSRKSKKGKV